MLECDRVFLVGVTRDEEPGPSPEKARRKSFAARAALSDFNGLEELQAEREATDEESARPTNNEEHSAQTVGLNWPIRGVVV